MGDDYETTVRIVLDVEGEDQVEGAYTAVDNLTTSSQGATVATEMLGRSTRGAGVGMRLLERSAMLGARSAGIFAGQYRGAARALSQFIMVERSARMMGRGMGAGGAGIGSGFQYAPGFGQFGATPGLGLGAALLPLGLMAGAAGLFAFAGYNVRGGGVRTEFGRSEERGNMPHAARGAIISSPGPVWAGEKEEEVIMPLRKLQGGGGGDITIKMDGETVYNLNKRRERIRQRAGAMP